MGRIVSVLALLLLLWGCKSTDEKPPQYVKVFTLAPVADAVVTDDNNQTAVYDPLTHRYNFPNEIIYPVSVKVDSNSYVDVDYDHTKSAADVKPLFSMLRSYCNEVNLLTELYYAASQEEGGGYGTTQEYTKALHSSYDVDPCEDPATSRQRAQVHFGAYDAFVQEGNLTSIEQFSSYVKGVQSFFKEYLYDLMLQSDAVRYYSYYDALLWLDKKRLTRSDTIHKPNIPSTMRQEVLARYRYDNLDLRDIAIYGGSIYVAAAHDEFAMLDSALGSAAFYGLGDIEAFGFSLFKQQYGGHTCLYLADGKSGLLPFDITGATARFDAIYSYIDASGAEQNLSDLGIIAANGFVSIDEKKRLLAIGTRDKGFYLFSTVDALNGCQKGRDLNESEDLLIATTSGFSADSAFREDGAALYVALKSEGLARYDLTLLQRSHIENSKVSFALEDEAEAYKLLLYPDSNELLVTTDKGLQIYDVTNDDNLLFVDSYQTEGATKEYLQQIEAIPNRDLVVLSDGTKGIKILKLDSSYHPTLCGVEYFAASGDNAALKRVSAVAYDTSSTLLYVGFESGGVRAYLLDDLLFKHCK